MTHSAASGPAVEGVAATVNRVHDHFTLADVNPLTGAAYAQSRYRELPPYAIAVIGVTKDAWDRLVGSGTVGLALDVHRVHSLAPMLAELKARQRMVWDGHLNIAEDIGALCEECLGTSIAHDFDASVTGVQDAPFVCFCAPTPRTRPTHLHLVVSDETRVVA
jgi:hypothetical protein